MPTLVDDPVIVLIGGTAGCGKTTLANDIVHCLDLDHRISTGFIRTIVQSQSDPAYEPELFRMTYESDDPIGNLRTQAARLLPAVTACIDRARAEGTSLVIEGTHLVPELFSDLGTRFIVLEAPGSAQHLQRLVGRHTRRSIAPEDLRRIRQIGDYYLEEASRLGVPTFPYDDNRFEIIEALCGRTDALILPVRWASESRSSSLRVEECSC